MWGTEFIRRESATPHRQSYVDMDRNRFPSLHAVERNWECLEVGSIPMDLIHGRTVRFRHCLWVAPVEGEVDAGNLRAKLEAQGDWCSQWNVHQVNTTGFLAIG